MKTLSEIFNPTSLKTAITVILTEFGFDAVWDLMKTLTKKTFVHETEGVATGVKDEVILKVGPGWLKTHENIIAQWGSLTAKLTESERLVLDGFLSDAVLGEHQQTDFQLNLVWLAYGVPRSGKPGDEAAALTHLREFAHMPDHATRLDRADSKNFLKGSEDEYLAVKIEKALGVTFTSVSDFIKGLIALASGDKATAKALLPKAFRKAVKSTIALNKNLPLYGVAGLTVFFGIHILLVHALSNGWAINGWNAAWGIAAVVLGGALLWRKGGITATGLMMMAAADWGPAVTVFHGLQRISLGAVLASVFFTYWPETAPLYWPLTSGLYLFVVMYLITGGKVDMRRWNRVAIWGMGSMLIGILISGLWVLFPGISVPRLIAEENWDRSVPNSPHEGYWSKSLITKFGGLVLLVMLVGVLVYYKLFGAKPAAQQTTITTTVAH